MNSAREKAALKYVDVAWVSCSEGEPVRLVSEVNESGFELRKLHFFRDGIVGFAYGNKEVNDTRLGSAPVPPVSEINSDKQFSAKYISEKQFEELWFANVSK